MEAEKSMRSPNCFLIFSHRSSQLGNLEYFVPLMICSQAASTPGR